MKSNRLDLDPITQQFVDKLNQSNAPPIYELSPIDARKVLSKIQDMNVHKQPVDIEDIMISVNDSRNISIRIMRPKADFDKCLPVVIYYHGGGWVLGDMNTHDRLIREITVGAGVALVFVNYTPSPEAQYPVPIQEAYTAALYIVENAQYLHLNVNRLAIMGDSVGGNMATVVTMLATENRNFDVHLQILLYPVTDANFDTESYHKFANGPWLTRRAMQWFWDNYLPDVSRRSEYTASPLRASLSQLRRMPKTLIITDDDVLRDEGEAYADRLSHAGVFVERARYLETIHDFAMLNPLADSPATRAVVNQVISTLRLNLMQ